LLVYSCQNVSGLSLTQTSIESWKIWHGFLTLPLIKFPASEASLQENNPLMSRYS